VRVRGLGEDHRQRIAGEGGPRYAGLHTLSEVEELLDLLAAEVP